MTQRIRDAFKELNDLYKEETGENVDGAGEGPDLGKSVPEGIEFSEAAIVLRLGRPRRLALLVNPAVVPHGAPIIFESESSQIRVDPDEVLFSTEHVRDGRVGIVPVLVSSDSLGAAARVTAYTEDRDGRALEALVSVTDTVPISMVLPPLGGMEFRPDEVTVKPHVRRSLQLWVDTEILPVGSRVVIRLYDYVEGLFLLGDDDHQYVTRSEKIRDRHRDPTNPRVARVLIPFRASGYGQFAGVRAIADTSDGTLEAEAEIHIREEEPSEGTGIFSDVDYDERKLHYACSFERGSGKLVVNARHPVNRQVFGPSFDTFKERIDEVTEAQIRLAEVVLDECIYHIAAMKHLKGGRHALTLGRDPITDIRNFIEERKFRIGPKIFRHFVKEL
jgi:hypothetical protein